MSEKPEELLAEARQQFQGLIPDGATPVIQENVLESTYAGATVVGRLRKWTVLYLGVWVIFLLTQSFSFFAYTDQSKAGTPFIGDASSVIDEVHIQQSGNLVFDWRLQSKIGQPAAVVTGCALYPVKDQPYTAGWVRPVGTDHIGGVA
jgi:hypothetical protein